MTIKEFCKVAQQNGYNHHLCEGWDWVRDNLHKLDYIFQKDEYKSKDGYKSLCMPLIFGNETLSDFEKDILSTAWYLNNDRERKHKQTKHRDKMLKEGWKLLNEAICREAIELDKKIELHGAVTNDWLTTQITGLYRPRKIEQRYFLVAPRKRNRGYWLGNLTESGEQDCFCKIA